MHLSALRRMILKKPGHGDYRLDWEYNTNWTIYELLRIRMLKTTFVVAIYEIKL
jgi:hypothetical protein